MQKTDTLIKHHSFARGIFINGILVSVLVIIFLIGCNVGQYQIAVQDIFSTLFGGGTQRTQLVLFDYRLPRLCLAFLVGLGMGMSGVVMQRSIRKIKFFKRCFTSGSRTCRRTSFCRINLFAWHKKTAAAESHPSDYDGCCYEQCVWSNQHFYDVDT
ncbi:MAG: iron chelate uptake ABC transporter family permease subunit [Clostridiales bacterium]|nr:iron chelate uptake ABC transporter family permease subunit [Clostridiales bacterium]